MVATASENGLKVAVVLASCLATATQTQEANPDAKNKRHEAKTSASSTESRACIYQEAYAQTALLGAATR